MKTAIVIGATGLIGYQLVQLLLKDERFDKVLVFTRRSTGYKSDKLEEHIINFDKPSEWKHLVTGDVLFSALGTTIKQAGTKKNQYKIDYTYQYQFAEAACRNDVPVYVLVSSAGADSKSSILYSRMKGELENSIKKLPFPSIYFIQPSLLVGERKHKRAGEKISYRVLKAINAIGILRKYKPIHGKTVAQALLNCGVEGEKGTHTITLDKVFDKAVTQVF